MSFKLRLAKRQLRFSSILQKGQSANGNPKEKILRPITPAA